MESDEADWWALADYGGKDFVEYYVSNGMPGFVLTSDVNKATTAKAKAMTFKAKPKATTPKPRPKPRMSDNATAVI